MMKPVSLENVRVGFRNFEGREGPFNKSGERSFVVFLDDETAQAMAADGWNIKFPRVQENSVDDDFTPQAYLPVSVGFEHFPANVFLISNGTPTKLGEQEVAVLDWAEIANVDLVIRPYEWSMRGKSGIKAYLKAGYFTIIEDQFAAKYGI